MTNGTCRSDKLYDVMGDPTVVQNQLELHRQQRSQMKQHQSGNEGRHMGVVPVGSASLLPPLPPKRQSSSKASSGLPVSSAALGPQSAVRCALNLVIRKMII